MPLLEGVFEWRWILEFRRPVIRYLLCRYLLGFTPIAISRAAIAKVLQIPSALSLFSLSNHKIHTQASVQPMLKMYSGNEFHTKSETFDLPTEEPNYDFDFEDGCEIERKRKQKQSYPGQVRDQVPDPPYTSDDYSQLFTTNQTFKNPSKAFYWVQRIGRDQKMEMEMEKVYVVRSSRAKGQLGIVRLCCERHKSYRVVPGTKDELGRRKVMKNLECPFAIECYQVDPKSWVLEVACGVHNQELGSNTLREQYELEGAAASASQSHLRDSNAERLCNSSEISLRNSITLNVTGCQ